MVSRRSALSNIQFKTVVFMLIFFISVMFVPSIKSILEGINTNINIRNEALNTLPELKKELSKIDAQMNALQSSDIGKRLSSIEKALKIGNLDKDQIKDLNNLTEEINVIQGYLSNDVNKILELRDLQTKALKIDSIEGKINDLIVVKNDLENFKNTTYVISGLLFTMFFGSWFITGRQKRPHIPVTKAGDSE